jgi:hypothetical protein
MNTYVLMSFVAALFAHTNTPSSSTVSQNLLPVTVEAQTSKNGVFFTPSTDSKHVFNRLLVERNGEQIISNTMVVSDEFSKRLTMPNNDTDLLPIIIQNNESLSVLEAFNDL